jgi:hypothetical protein
VQGRGAGPRGGPLAGPLTVLLLPLLLGACVINLLTRFSRNQMDTVKLQLVRQYQRLPLDDFPKTVIRKPRERSKPGKGSKTSKALPLSRGPCFQLSRQKLQMAFIHSCADMITLNS